MDDHAEPLAIETPDDAQTGLPEPVEAVSVDAPTDESPATDHIAAEPALAPLMAAIVPPAPAGWSDPATGTDGPRYWDRIISSERARVRRYRRPATVALVELVGLDKLSRRWGPDVADRALVICARTLAKEIRSSDHIARIETGRFGLLLTETSEIDAINFVERARASCERELQAAGGVAVAFGWASPPKNGDLGDALQMATDRLEAEVRDLS
jgi:diguanylate cyclase (GGDEF)-like protein